MLSTSFAAKTLTLYSSQNTWPIRQKAFSYKFYPSFFIYLFFNRIFHLYLRPLNILCTSFRAKMATLHLGRNSWPVGSRSTFVQNLPQLRFLSKEILDLSELGVFCTNFTRIFFFFRKNFQFFSWTSKYAICKFWCKNDDIVFQSKYLTSRTKRHFPTNFTWVFLFIYFSIEFSISFRDL